MVEAKSHSYNFAIDFEKHFYIETYISLFQSSLFESFYFVLILFLFNFYFLYSIHSPSVSTLFEKGHALLS